MAKMKVLDTVQKYTSTGFWQVAAAGILLIVIVFVEKEFFPSAKELTQFNTLGRSSVVLPLLAGLIFFAWTKDTLFKIDKLKWNWIQVAVFGALHIAAVLGFIWLKNFIISDTAAALEHFNLVVAVRYALPALIVVFLAFALFPLRVFRRFWVALAGSVGLAYVFFQLSLWFKGFWNFFADGVSAVVVVILQLLGHDVTRLTGAENAPIIQLTDFSLTINHQCSGIESMSLFALLFALILIVDRDKINWKKAAIAFVPGIILMYGVNVIRIVVLFLVAIYYNLQFAIHTFHTNAGWILFILYFAIFWSLSFKFITAKKSDRKLGRKKKGSGKRIGTPALRDR
ncbi:MAG: archaeosortase/exosortase family protein [Candidatus Kerfeldbacteria bacterium]